jgi:hypothetical protein
MKYYRHTSPGFSRIVRAQHVIHSIIRQDSKSEFIKIRELPTFSSGMINQVEFQDGTTLYQHRNNGRTRHRHRVRDRMYLHLVTLSATNRTVFKISGGQASAVSVDIDFLRNSEIYLAYSWDFEFIRSGLSGSALALQGINPCE